MSADIYSHPYNSQDYDPAAPVVEIKLLNSSNNKEIVLTALIDSGADASMIPFSALATIEARYLETRRMRGITGRSLTFDTYLATI